VQGDAFEREYGCTETEWLRWLPDAVHGHALMQVDPGSAQVTIDHGHLQLHWTLLPPRQIALMRLPRLQVSFAFSGVDEPARSGFMRGFDLRTQRGGG
jgi:hypothetical protein